jgi:mono/diheme cytochrome c family protein
MRTRLLLLGLLLIFAFTLFSEQSEAPKSKPAASATSGSDNPVKPTPESLAKAKKLFGYDCAMCHGENGDGKGDLAGDFKNKPKDYTDPASLKDYTDQQLFLTIKDGKADMPPEGKRAKAEDLWGLVNYLRTLSKK